MTILPFIHFVSDSVEKVHALLIYCIYDIEETTPVEKTSIIYFVI